MSIILTRLIKQDVKDSDIGQLNNSDTMRWSLINGQK